MDKKILEQYIDACENVKETEKEITRLKKRKRIVQDAVKGSNPEFPYQAQSFHIEGIAEGTEDNRLLDEEQRILSEHKATAAKIKTETEAWMNTIPQRMQRIIRYKIFYKMSWKETANKLGRGATADGVRMEFKNFMEN